MGGCNIVGWEGYNIVEGKGWEGVCNRRVGYYIDVVRGW